MKRPDEVDQALTEEDLRKIDEFLSKVEQAFENAPARKSVAMNRHGLDRRHRDLITSRLEEAGWECEDGETVFYVFHPSRSSGVACQQRPMVINNHFNAPVASAQSGTRNSANVTQINAGVVSPGFPDGTAPVSLTMDHKAVSIHPDVHHYNLAVRIKNEGKRKIDHWYIEIKAPTILIPQLGSSQGDWLKERRDPRWSWFRCTLGMEGQKVLLVGDEWVYLRQYYVTHDIFWNHQDALNEIITAQAFVDGDLITTVQRPMSELQNF
jgi:hypothetical protein